VARQIASNEIKDDINRKANRQILRRALYKALGLAFKPFRVGRIIKISAYDKEHRYG
jgi:hypothetical protein